MADYAMNIDHLKMVMKNVNLKQRENNERKKKK